MGGNGHVLESRTCRKSYFWCSGSLVFLFELQGCNHNVRLKQEYSRIILVPNHLLPAYNIYNIARFS